MLKTGRILYYIIGVIGVAFGGYYLFVNNMAPYHYAFMQMDKEQIDAFNPRILELMIALKHIAGACFIGIGIITLFIASRIKAGSENICIYNLGLFLMLLISNSTVLYISYHVAQQIDKGPKPPWYLSAVIVLLLLGAFAAVSKGRKEVNCAC
ncbi:MAG TPA: hypothetical protein DIU39_00900 [Flavobacteriales bacterium]|nr:hypothetical protein [Flavobacteriales bacterium]|tara:strand:- start:86573 stop:87031 length:459 start_codon:yes stop_codon:yes gene_type:complete